MIPEYLNTKQAAKILRLHERTVSGYCKQGRLGERIGPTWQITPADAERFNEIERPVGYPGRAAKKEAETKRKLAGKLKTGQ